MSSEPPQGPYKPPTTEEPTEKAPTMVATEQTNEEIQMPDSSSLEQVSESTADYAKRFQNTQPQHSHKRQKGSRRWLKVLITLIILGVLGGGGYVSYRLLTDPIPENNSKTTDTSQETTNTTTQTDEPVTQKTYTSEDLNLSLEYPSNWTINDAKNDVLELTSQTVDLTDENGETAPGHVTIRIVPTSAGLTSFPTSGAIATRDSLSFAYTAPAEGQREQSTLSFVNTSGEEGYVDFVFISGSKTYKAGDSVKKADFSEVQPIISVQFLTASIRNIGLKTGSWEAVDILQEDTFDILKSLSLQ